MLDINRQTGSYYTTDAIAEYMAGWAIRSSNDILLEPSFGDGIFIDKAWDTFQMLRNKAPEIHAVELQEQPYSRLLSRAKRPINAYNQDFLDFTLSPIIDAAIGNPPYVSLKNLPDLQQMKALELINRQGMNISMNGSLWFPFLIHATTMLREEGRLAFVMPYEIAYVRYAHKLWHYLGKNYSHITLIRIYEDFFPDVDVETVLLLLDGKGGSTTRIDYKVYNAIEDLYNKDPVTESQISIYRIADGSKPFTSALLADEPTYLLMKLKDQGIIEPIIKSCKSKIGYVSADKKFFHPDRMTAREFGLPDDNFIPCILNSKDINGGTGIGLQVTKGQCESRLYLPGKITPADESYIKYGEETGVSQKYKCRQRKPWYVTPNVETPDVIISVFGDVPKLIINDGDYAISNSLLCGSLKEGIDAKNFICRWYNSLTLLSIEMNVHSLGGGSLVIIPGEADALDIIKPLPQNLVDSIYKKLDAQMLAGNTQDVYNLGDELVLKDVYQFTEKQIKAIREAVVDLRKWRIPNGRRNS